jgi:GDSL-like Lipase/Acylhydrolase family
MTTTEMGSVTTARFGIIKALALLALGLVPWPADWDKVRDVVDSVRSPELNRAERDGHAGGYYEGLIGGREASDLSRGDSSQRLIGNPSGWVPFKEANVVHYLDGEFLQFELQPAVERTLFGKPFVTNDFGMHDAPVATSKPDGTFRIAVVGSSIDMGWGVTYQDTYINQLEQWLNAHSARLGLTSARRFEVLNFAVAAYSPMQRLETLRTKVMSFHPDAVVYSATTNDLRLMEIHLCELLRKKLDLRYDFLREIVSVAGLDRDDLHVDADGELTNKARVKHKLQPFYWSLYDATLGAIAAECRTAGLPLVMVIVPRVGKADVPPARAEPVARLKAIASRQGLTVFDITDSFDPFDAAMIEIAVGDDHPNAIGHRRLFLALARALVKDEELYHLLFTPGPKSFEK